MFFGLLFRAAWFVNLSVLQKVTYAIFKRIFFLYFSHFSLSPSLRRATCREGLGFPPLYVNVNMKTGDLANNWVDALQAAWPAVLVLNGHVDEAICVHAYFYAIWRKYGVLPERFNW